MISRLHYERQQLQDYLNSTDDAIGTEITAHVEECQQCQLELESIATDDFDWEQASHLLRQGEKPQGEIATADVSVDQLSFLEPSEHPGAIGSFARYEVLKCLGRGGMGIVCRVFDPELNRHSAIKVLAPELTGSAAAKKRFSREAKSAAAVVHPHVVPIQTVDEYNGLPYLVMPVVEGQSLQQRVESNGPLSVLETVRIAAQIADGLAAAHAQGLVHRDIKPANILLDLGVERVQITDFGLARAIDDASMTRSGVIAGTPQYMSPEQAHGDDIDHRSDLFSLGSVMYFMLTGRSPFRAETVMGVLNRIGHDEPRRLRAINPDVPEWLEEIVRQLLEKDREQRFQTAEEVTKVLQQWQAHLQQPNEVPPPKTIKTANNTGRSKIVKWLAALGGLAALITLASVILLETSKGTIRIESNSDSDVSIVIRQGNKEVQELTVSKQGAKLRLYAGTYEIEVDDANADVTITGDRVELKRGDEWIARLVREAKPPASDHLANSDHSSASILNKELKKESAQYLVWEPANKVRLSHWLAKSLRLEDAKLEDVNQLLSETWAKYIEFERKHTTYSRKSNGHFHAEVGYPVDSEKGKLFENQWRQLDDEFWIKLDQIVSGDQRELLHALSTARGDGNGDDTWSDEAFKDGRPRPKAYPSIIGWKLNWYPVEVEIWKKGTWFHYMVFSANRYQLGPGDAQELPPILQHYYEFAQQAVRDQASPPVYTPTPPAGSPIPVSPEYASVKVSVIDEEGMPLPGAEVSLSMQGQKDRPVEVENSSKANGVAINQVLPYGKYQMRVTTPDGWRLRRLMNPVVQFGKGLDLTVTAPAVGELCETQFVTGRKAWSDPVSKLRFGEVHEMSGGRSYFNKHTPEPGQPLGHFSSFATPSNGIDELAYQLYVNLSRVVKQSDESDLEWIWEPSQPQQPLRYMVTKNAIQPYEFGRSRPFIPTNKTGFFLDSDDNDIRNVGTAYQLGEPAESPLVIQHPAGQLTVYLTNVCGLPNAEARAAMRLQPSDLSTWLPLNLQNASKWLPLLIDTEDWSPYRPAENGITHGHVLRQDFQLKPAEKTTVRLNAVFREHETELTHRLIEVKAQEVNNELQLITITSGSDDGLRLNQHIHSSMPRGGSRAVIIEIKPDIATARIVKIDPKYPFQTGQTAYIFGNRSNPNEGTKMAFRRGDLLYLNFQGDRTLFIGDPENQVSGMQPFTRSGVSLMFSLKNQQTEQGFHILNEEFASVRATVRVECSESNSDEFWERFIEQPVDLNISYDDYISVRSGNLLNRVVYLTKDGKIQTKTYEGIGRPSDVVEDVRQLGGAPIVSLKLDPPTTADKVAASHQEIGPAFVSKQVAEQSQRSWQSDPYQAPDFESFFPDDVEGGIALDRLWNSADKDSRSDDEILGTARRGLRRTRQHRTLVLAWIGNKYIWNKSQQNPDAIEIMYHAADISDNNLDPYGTRHYAIYFGLSVTQPKSPAILRTLAEIGMKVDDPNDLERIAWGSSNQRDELLKCLEPFQKSEDAAIREKAEICRKIFGGELKAFAWAKEQAQERAKQEYSERLPEIKQTLLNGNSEERASILRTILQERLALIMDETFIAAFAKCAEDADPDVRNRVAIIVGAQWVWEAQPQNPAAIDLMLKLSEDDNREVRYNAVYYGLSTVRSKSDQVIRRLLEIAFADREPNLFGRIIWGLRDDRIRVKKILKEYMNGPHQEHAEAARELDENFSESAEPVFQDQ